MKDTRFIGSVAAVALAMASCKTSGGTPSAPTQSGVERAPDEKLVARFFGALRDEDAATVEAMLASSPGLAEASDADGTSAFMRALLQVHGEGFVPPRENRLVAAIVARKPRLDPLEAAATSDAKRVSEAIAADDAYTRRVHPIGWTALHFAAFAGQTENAAHLLAHGADPNAQAKNPFDNTPLHVALLTGESAMVPLLLAHGADVNVRQGEGLTALHEAAQNGDARVVRMLLDAGADVTVRGGKKRESALDVAVAAKHPEVVALLRSRGAQ